MSEIEPLTGTPRQRSTFRQRLFSRDTTLWSTGDFDSSQITDRLGWLDAISFSRNQLARLRHLSSTIKQDGFDHVVLLGMGGSSLAPQVFARCFSPGSVEMTVLDTTYPDSVSEVAASLIDRHPLFIVSSKSGTTAETVALRKYFHAWCEQRYGSGCGEHFIAITDNGSSLHQIAEHQAFRDIFINPADIGGRFSALSFFGLVPACLGGVDIARILDRAQGLVEDHSRMDLAVGLGVFMGEAAKRGRDKLTLVFSSRLEPLGAWIEQLVAESTGKLGKGVVPIVDEPALPYVHYQQDRMFVDVEIKGDPFSIPDASERRQQLKRLGHPVLSLQIDDIYDLGAEFMRWQVATSIAASIIGVNPFDEPDVNATKDATRYILSDGEAVVARTATGLDPTQPSLLDFLSGVEVSDYICVLAYLPPARDLHRSLQELRNSLGRRFNTATCLAFGPRYLHSSGQLHKGGRINGHFIVLTARGDQSVAIPGEAYGFQYLIDAQAKGDIEVLRQRGQKVLHIDLGPVDGAAGSLGKLSDLFLD